MKKITYEEFELHLEDLVRWGHVKVDLNENGVEVYSLTGFSLEDQDLCEGCGQPLPHSSKQ